MEILNTISCPDDKTFTIFVLILFSTVCAILLILLIYALIDNEDASTIFAIIIFLGAFIILVTACIKNLTNKYDKYEVVFNDTIPFKEVCSKYEVLEQHGEIYVIKEKMTDEEK